MKTVALTVLSAIIHGINHGLSGPCVLPPPYFPGEILHEVHQPRMKRIPENHVERILKTFDLCYSLLT